MRTRSSIQQCGRDVIERTALRCATEPSRSALSALKAKGNDVHAVSCANKSLLLARQAERAGNAMLLEMQLCASKSREIEMEALQLLRVAQFWTVQSAVATRISLSDVRDSLV